MARKNLHPEVLKIEQDQYRDTLAGAKGAWGVCFRIIFVDSTGDRRYVYEMIVDLDTDGVGTPETQRIFRVTGKMDEVFLAAFRLSALERMDMMGHVVRVSKFYVPNTSPRARGARRPVWNVKVLT